MDTVADLMVKDVLTVDPSDTIGEAAEKMNAANVGASSSSRTSRGSSASSPSATSCAPSQRAHAPRRPASASG
jgi:CBS domain-containing protein